MEKESTSESDSDVFFDCEDDQKAGAGRRSAALHGRRRSSADKQSQPIIEKVSQLPVVTISKTSSSREETGIDGNSSSGQQEIKAANCVTDGGDQKFRVPGVHSDERDRRRKLRHLRNKLRSDEDGEEVAISPGNSRTSSIDGVYAISGSRRHPFKVIEADSLSLQSAISLGKIGRILGGSEPSIAGLGGTAASFKDATISHQADDKTDSPHDISHCPNLPPAQPTGNGSLEKQATVRPTPLVLPAFPSPPEEDEERSESPLTPVIPILQEPDLVASTKNNNQGKIPVAPPRKKKSKASTHASPGMSLTPRQPEKVGSFSSVMSSDVSPLSHGECGSVFLSPLKVTPSGKGIESLAQDQENSLDIRSAIQGQFVVKPQDEDSTRAEGPGQELSGVLVPGVGSASLSPQHSSSPSEDAYLSLEDTSKYYSFDSKQSSLDSKTSGSRDSKRSSLDSRRSKKEPLGVVSSSPSHSMSGKGSFDRDADIMKQLNMFVRTRTDSGRLLSDKEILEQVTVLNLDTGERVPLSVAEEKLPSCVNPLSLHIMRLTSEYIGNSSLDGDRESDTESVCTQKSSIGGDSTEGSSVKKRTLQLKRFLGRTVGKTVNKAKSMAQHHVGRHKDSDPMSDLPDDTAQGDTGQIVRMKASSSHKGPYDFDGLVYIQNLSGEHSLPIWTMKFSQCGRLLATAGQDRGIRIWVLKDAFSYFQDMRTRYNAEIKTSPTPSQESLQSQHSQEERRESGGSRGEEMRDDPTAPFMPQPFCIYKGHNADVLDVSWSKNYFLLSSSMDKTVRLWHISRKEGLCCFQHIDFVTAISFHPKDDRYFLSGSLDGKLRLWYIPDKKVALWNEVEGTSKLITAASFCQNGKIAVVGTYDGRCIFYNTEELKYFTQIHVRSTRGKNAKGRKISGIEPAPGEDKILVTSNDSRIRLYDLRDLSLSCKYKGCLNQSSQIRACFSHDGKYIISGSENQCFYVWKTHHDYAKFSSARRDRNDYWEGIKAHNAVVTVAAFAPHPETILRQMEREKARRDGAKVKAGDRSDHPQGYFLVTADFHGCIKVFMSTTKPKHSSLPASALA